MLDWQYLRYASPAIDLLYYIFCSTDKQTRDAEYFNLLRCYHDALSATVEKLGSNPCIFTFDNLLDELKKCGNYLIVILPMMIQMMSANPNDFTNMDEMADKVAEGKCEHFDMITKLDESGKRKYDQLLNDCMDDAVRLGYFHPLDCSRFD